LENKKAPEFDGRRVFGPSERSDLDLDLLCAHPDGISAIALQRYRGPDPERESHAVAQSQYCACGPIFYAQLFIDLRIENKTKRR